MSDESRRGHKSRGSDWNQTRGTRPHPKVGQVRDKTYEVRGIMALPTPLQAFSGVPKINTAPDKQTIVDGEKMTGAQALIRSLEDLGVEDVFGIPGGAILPVYHEIKDNTKFRFVLMRHEQAAGHAAEGYALATGKVGVCIVTSARVPQTWSRPLRTRTWTPCPWS